MFSNYYTNPIEVFIFVHSSVRSSIYSALSLRQKKKIEECFELMKENNPTNA